jgi:hypothetical protein
MTVPKVVDRREIWLDEVSIEAITKLYQNYKIEKLMV